MITEADIYCLPVRNDSGEEVPPFAVMRATGVVERDGGLWVQKVTKPDTTFARLYLINGPAKIPVDGYGMATDGRRYPCIVGISTDTANVAGGWGVSNASWTLRRNRPGNFTCIGESHTDYALFSQEYCNLILGRLTGVLVADGSQTVNLTTGLPASIAEGAVQATVYDKILLADKQLPDDTYLAASWRHGAWYMDWWVGDCSEDQP